MYLRPYRPFVYPKSSVKMIVNEHVFVWSSPDVFENSDVTIEMSVVTFMDQFENEVVQIFRNDILKLSQF